MPKPPQTKEEAIDEVIEDVHKAMLADLKAKQRSEEIAREKTKTHYDLIKAKERLWMLED
jgi:hypothetical protein